MPSGYGLDTPAGLEQDALELARLSTSLSTTAETFGTAVGEVGAGVDGMGAIWSGPRSADVISRSVSYINGVKTVVGALNSASSTISSWSATALARADELRRWTTSVSNLEDEAARGVSYEGQQSDLANARGQVQLVRDAWHQDCLTYSAELEAAMTTISLVTLAVPDLGDVRLLADAFYYPALAQVSVETGIDLPEIDPTGALEAAVANWATLLGSEDGGSMFGIFDVAFQGDLDKADGNLSTDDIEAACDAAKVEALLVQAAEKGGYTWDRDELDAMIAQITGMAWMMRSSRDNVWEDIDDEVGLFDTVTGFINDYVFAPVIGITVGGLCFAGAAAAGTATGGIGYASAGYCGGLGMAAYRAADNWAHGEGVEGVINGFTDPEAWAVGAGSAIAMQGATNFLLRIPAGPAAAGTAEGSENLYHYTFRQWVDDIEARGLGRNPSGVTFATPNGELSPLQAHIELALTPNSGFREVVVEIDVAAMRAAGYEIPAASRITSTVVGSDGRVYSMPGGGTEVVFDYVIPADFLKVVFL